MNPQVADASNPSMARHRHLSRAPIKEAVIDIRLAPMREVSLDHLWRELAQRYPSQMDIWNTSFGFEVGADGVAKPMEATRAPNGKRLTDTSGRYVAQIRTDGFTFSRLPPYETWEDLREEAMSLWKLYLPLIEGSRVTRVATRYINVLPLKMPIDFDDYLTVAPQVPSDLPQAIHGFFCRLALPDPETGATTIVTQASETGTQDAAPVTLDIDTFKDMNVVATDEAVWTTLDQLRNVKNKIFFEYITERTAELFE